MIFSILVLKKISLSEAIKCCVIVLVLNDYYVFHKKRTTFALDRKIDVSISSFNFLSRSMNGGVPISPWYEISSHPPLAVFEPHHDTRPLQTDLYYLHFKETTHTLCHCDWRRFSILTFPWNNSVYFSLVPKPLADFKHTAPLSTSKKMHLLVIIILRKWCVGTMLKSRFPFPEIGMWFWIRAKEEFILRVCLTGSKELLISREKKFRMFMFIFDNSFELSWTQINFWRWNFMHDLAIFHSFIELFELHNNFIEEKIKIILCFILL